MREFFPTQPSKNLYETVGPAVIERCRQNWSDEVSMQVVASDMARLVYHDVDTADWQNANQYQLNYTLVALDEINRELKLSRVDGSIDARSFMIGATHALTRIIERKRDDIERLRKRQQLLPLVNVFMATVYMNESYTVYDFALHFTKLHDARGLDYINDEIDIHGLITEVTRLLSSEERQLYRSKIDPIT